MPVQVVVERPGRRWQWRVPVAGQVQVLAHMEREMRTPGWDAIPRFSFGERGGLAADVDGRDHGSRAQRHVGRAAVKYHWLARAGAGAFGKKDQRLFFAQSARGALDHAG